MISAWSGRFLLIVLGVFLLILPWLDMPSYVALFISMAFYGVGTLGFRALMTVGRFSLGQSFFVAIGAYVSAILCTKAGFNPWVGLLLSGLAGVVLAYLFGLIVLRIPGMYFAIITMALTTVSVQILALFPEVTGGVAGLGKIPAYSIGSYNFGINPMPYYYFILTLLAFTFWILQRIERSPLGLITRAIGQNDELTRHLGVNISQQRLTVFTLVGGITSLSGAFWAHYLHYINPDQVGLMLGIYYQIFAIVGGLTSLWGSLLGVASLELVSHWLGIALYIQPILYGAVLVVVFMLLPRGLLSLPARVRAIFKRRAARVEPSEAKA